MRPACARIGGPGLLAAYGATLKTSDAGRAYFRIGSRTAAIALGMTAMDTYNASATTAATVNRIAYSPPPSTRPATSIAKPVSLEPGPVGARQRPQERPMLEADRGTSYEPGRNDRQQTFGARYGQVGLTLDVKA